MVKARELAGEAFGVTAVAGDLELDLTRASSLDRAGPGALTFVKAAELADAPASFHERIAGAGLVCPPSLAAELEHKGNVALLLSDRPRLTFMRLVSRFFPAPRPPSGIHPTAVVDPSADISGEVSIGPFCMIGPGCIIGPQTVLHANVVLQAEVRVGRNVTIHSGTVIGADGFGYERAADGTMEKFPHLGGVVIEDDVEIGSNTSIDRGALGDTILRRGCKIDNQIHVAHNVVVGENAVIIAQAMIGGSVRIGDRAWIAPAAVILNQVAIGADALVGLGAIVTRDVPPGVTVLGAPAVPEAEFKANRAALKRLFEGRHS